MDAPLAVRNQHASGALARRPATVAETTPCLSQGAGPAQVGRLKHAHAAWGEVRLSPYEKIGASVGYLRISARWPVPTTTFGGWSAGTARSTLTRGQSERRPRAPRSRGKEL